LAYRFTTTFLKNETVFLLVLASPGHPQCNSVYISEGVHIHIANHISALL